MGSAMRDIVITLAIFAALLRGFKHPWVALMVWVVVSVLNPHRYTYGFAYDMPFALMAAGVIFTGMVFTKDEMRTPFNPPGVLLMVLCVWVSITTVLAFFPQPSFGMLERVLKIYLMVIVASSLIVTERQIKVLTWVLALCIAVLSTKGGLFTIASGGSYRVWGPPASFIEDNNAFALASIMTVPLLFFLAGECNRAWLKWALRIAAVLTVFSALGSQSRGALLAILAMTAFLLMKSRKKLGIGLAVLILVPIVMAFLPDQWFERMQTLKNHEQDLSAMGRINAWHMAFNLANDRFFGGGFALANPFVFGLYAPDPLNPLAAHSIYFQMLGEHGWVGLGLYVAFWTYTWFSAGWVARRVKDDASLAWAASLTRMLQVSLIAFAVGGAFLSLAYFDLPFYEAVLVYALKRWVTERLAQSAPTALAPQGAG
jgi:putative inorganic carbon (hco3(-)) transporter